MAGHEGNRCVAAALCTLDAVGGHNALSLASQNSMRSDVP
jgi:hypothetical protein